MKLYPCSANRYTVPMDNRGMRVMCIKCGVFLDLEHALADADGMPFRDYYCQPCAMQVGESNDKAES